MGMRDLANNREVNFPPEGWEGQVKCIDARAGDTANGFPKFGLFLEILDGEFTGRSFWDNVFFSANARANHQSLAKLEAAGVEKEFWDKDPEPEPDVIDKLVSLRFGVRATYDPNENDPQNPWLRCVYYPNENGSASATPEGKPEGF